MDFWLCTRNNGKMVKNVMNMYSNDWILSLNVNAKGNWIFRKYFIFIFPALNIKFLGVYVDDYDSIISFSVYIEMEETEREVSEGYD